MILLKIFRVVWAYANFIFGMAGLVFAGIAVYFLLGALIFGDKGFNLSGGKLFGARGHSTKWFLIAGSSIGGRWASPTGVKLSFRDTQSNYQTSETLAAPSNRNWGPEIKDESHKMLEFSGSIDLPEIPGPVTKTLEGQLEGTISFPSREGNNFISADNVLDRELFLEVVPVERYQQILSERNWAARRAPFFDLLWGCAIIAGAILSELIRGRMKPKEAQPPGERVLNI